MSKNHKVLSKEEAHKIADNSVQIDLSKADMEQVRELMIKDLELQLVERKKQIHLCRVQIFAVALVCLLFIVLTIWRIFFA